MSNSSEMQNEKDAVKLRLLQFRDRENDLRVLFDRLDIIEMQMKSVTSPTLSDMPNSKSPFRDRTSYMVAVKVDLEKEIQQLQEDQYHIRNDIETILKKLKKAEERAVIRSRYLDCSFYHEDRLCDWNDVNNTLFGDRDDFLEKEESYLRRIHKIHSAALLNLSKLLKDFPVIE